MNRGLLYRFIPPGAHGMVAVYTSADLTDPIMFDGGDWRMYLMGMRDNDCTEAPELIEVTQ